MPRDQRKKSRRNITATAYIYSVDGWPIGECKTLDMSETGAKLAWTSEEEVPPEFLLSMSRDGKVRRRCCVKWRTPDSIGVKFVVS
jgi:hypothetical protein